MAGVPERTGGAGRQFRVFLVKLWGWMRRRLAACVVVAVVVVIAVAAVALNSVTVSTSTVPVPWHPRPLARLDSNAGLEKRINRVVAQFLEVKPLDRITHLYHYWRLLGSAAPWGDNAALQAQMQVMFSHSEFCRAYPDSPPIIFQSPTGLRVRMKSVAPSELSWPGEAHIDQFLAICAEVGVPLEQKIQTRHETTTVGALLRSSRENFVRDQEACFSIIAYCSYLPREPNWQNRFGEWMSYELIAQDLVAQDLGEGTCAGTHAQYALAHLLALDDLENTLGWRTRCQVESTLRRSADALVRSQLPDGSWHRDWAESTFPGPERLGELRAIADLILVTGHHLEWIALVPHHLRPNDTCVVAATRFVLTAIERQGQAELQKYYPDLSHGIHALSVLGSQELSESTARKSGSAAYRLARSSHWSQRFAP